MIKTYSKELIKNKKVIDFGYEADLYLDKNTILKIFKNDNYITSSKKEKLELLKELNIPYLTNPIDEIKIDDELKGYTMDYFKSTTLYEYKTKNENKIELLKRVRNLMIDIHNKDIIIGDLKANNILINKKKEIKICDIDSFKINNYNPEMLNYYAKIYFKKHNIYDEGMDIYSFNFMTLLYLLNMSYTDTYFYIEELYRQPEDYKKEIFNELLNNSKYEQDYLLDDKEKIKRLI